MNGNIILRWDWCSWVIGVEWGPVMLSLHLGPLYLVWQYRI